MMWSEESEINMRISENKIKKKQKETMYNRGELNWNEYAKLHNEKVKENEKMEKMEEKKEYAKGIYIKKLEGKYGEWLSVSIKKDDGSYDNYKFYPKKEQKSDKYTEFYGVFDNNFKSEKKEENQENIVKFGDEEIPF